MGIVLIGYGLYYSLLAVTSPWWAPHLALEQNNPLGTARAMRFADYPYADGARGLLLAPHLNDVRDDDSPSSDDAEPRPTIAGQLLSVRFGAESGMGVSDGIVRVGLHARVQLPLRLQFDSDWSMFREHDRAGIDSVFMGREHVTVRFAESSRMQFYSGVGPQHFCDSRGCLHGIDLTWGFEAFPGRPFVLGVEGSVGNLEQAFAPGVRAKLGYLFGPVEASLGWHQRWVGDVPLGGPFVGLAGWF